MSNPLFGRLLVPTDGSKDSVEAGELAFRIAQEQRAQVTVLHVVDLDLLEQTVGFSEKTRSEVRERMRREGENYIRHLEKIAQRYEVEVREAIREGDPHKEIVDLADEKGVDLIVMGHAGRRGPRRKIVGSVAERVIRFAPCPVLVCKGQG
ncbi:MAG: universal stress protein [Candidatus Promineifilaceae bacterium]|nr:universal stress protein [Candidatus Promineifilaceae bacterium]